jgi:methionine-rich copper-binding protein CopC
LALRRAVLAAAVLVATAALAASGLSASAHANLERAEPPADSRLAQPPASLSLYFTQALKPESSWVQLRDASDIVVVEKVEFDPANGKLMKVTLPVLAPGSYTVKWQTLSADDDDYAQGSYGLTILRPDGSDPGSSASPRPTSSDGGGNGSTLLYVGAAAAVLVAAGFGFWLLGRRAR